jgi:CBS domain-containing protein
MHLRLVHQVAQIERGEESDNHVDPATLSDLEKQTLKEAFAVAVRLQSYLKDLFHMHMG